jgi:hypothetical protein
VVVTVNGGKRVAPVLRPVRAAAVRSSEVDTRTRERGKSVALQRPVKERNGGENGCNSDEAPSF